MTTPTAPDGNRLPNYTGCDHPAGCQTPDEGCVGPCPVTPEEGRRIEREMYGDRLPATNSGQEVPPCGDRYPGQPAHVSCRRSLGHEPPHRWENEYAVWEWEPAPQQPPAQEREDDRCRCWHGNLSGRCREHGIAARSTDPGGDGWACACPRPAPPSEADSAGEDGLVVRLGWLADDWEREARELGVPGPGGNFASAASELRAAIAASSGVRGGDDQARERLAAVLAENVTTGVDRKPWPEFWAEVADIAVTTLRADGGGR
jgi:hypothetical protein